MISNQMPAPSSASAHSPDLGGITGLAVHLEHPPVVGKEQLQGLSEKENACCPDPSGEDDHAEKFLGLWCPIGAITIGEGGRLQDSPLMPSFGEF